MLCQFQVSSKVIQLYICIYEYMYSFFLYSSIIGCYKIVKMVPCVIQQIIVGYPFYTQQCVYFNLGFTGNVSGKDPAYQCRNLKKHGFSPWVRKIPQRKAWQPTPVFLPGESHGQRSLVGYSPQHHKELDTTKAIQHTMHTLIPNS